ncbi:YiiX/YebB-like N1pC/P60 family cysteine hydrolase [Oceanivirga salmonicida]|uniref:YiiX/YebB-like N1pC/P60 family cysteine hydrolase n=1 Tax=Oceanivirga salmonicida TaxID=1769291 RepID=UPI00082CD28C|nr:YiiX/YebB-like N1pC/P60 family cysteine hydrolase [Oceanivirga salmonicida]
MKKILICLLFITNLTFAAGFNDIQMWYPITMLPEIKDKLQEGDIIIFKPLTTKFTSRFGHIAIVGKDKKIVDFPDGHVGFREMPIEIVTTQEYRDVIVIRYKNSTKEFREKLMEKVYSYIDKNYFILSFHNLSKNTTYCSLFIRDVYELANDTDKTIFPESNILVLPEEFINAGENFYILELE